MSATPEQTLSLAFAQGLRDLLLPSVESAHKLNRQLLHGPMAKNLEFKPAAPMQSMGDILWGNMATGHQLLATIADGRTPAQPVKPAILTADSLIAWDEAHFVADYKAVAVLSHENLDRTVEFAGVTAPAVNLLVSYLSMAAQFVGQFSVYLQAAASLAEAAEPTGELTDEELSVVSGGTTYVTMSAGTNASLKISGPTQSSWTAQQMGWFGPSQTQSDLGSLFMTSSPKINAIMGDLAGAILSFIPIGTPGIGAALSAAERAQQAAAMAEILAREGGKL